MTNSSRDMPCSVPLPASAWPAHVSAPGEDGWCLWRDAVLRSAGFPADWAARLSDPVLSACADRANESGAALHAHCRHALQVVADLVAASRQAPAADALAQEQQRSRLRALGQASKALVRREVSDLSSAVLPPALFDRLSTLAGAHAADVEAFARACKHAQESTSAALAELCADDRFQRAVAWQNHAALDAALRPLASGQAMSGSRRRQREALVANYVQRYSLKNDTIGFFGPMAWVRIGAPGEPSRLEASGGAVRRRVVRFEDWPVSALAERLSMQDDLFSWLVPRRQPYLWREGTRLLFPGGAGVNLDAAQAAAFDACDGLANVGAVVRRLLANPFSPFASAREAIATLRELQRLDRIWMGWAVPSGDPRQERALRHRLEAVADVDVRRAALASLDALVEAKNEIARSAADVVPLERSLAALDEVFESVTGLSARRRGGEAYGGRALVYEDCHRDVALTLGDAATQALRRPLGLVLDSARWFTSEAARCFNDTFAGIHAQMLAPDTRDVPLATFWLRIQALVFGEFAPIDALATQLRERWESLLKLSFDGREKAIQLDASALVDAVRAAFPAGLAGWATARHQCPDLMFCARSPEAMLRGDFLAVLGEVHLGGNTLGTNMFISLHPDPDAFVRGMRHDLGGRYAMPKLSPESSRTPIRTQWADDTEGCVELLFSSGVVPANASTAMPVGELDVRREDDGLVVVHRRTGWRCSLLDAIGDFLTLAVINRFGIVRKRPHLPRITVDRLVLQREAWHVGVDEIAELLIDDDADNFRALRRWSRGHGMPEHAFIKVPWEDKPFFADFRSLASMRHLARQVRKGMTQPAGAPRDVSLSEMLPGFDGLWLNDAAGRACTCELRIVCIHADDLAPEAA